MSDACPDPSETAPALAMTPDWMRLLQADRMDVLAAALRAWLARHGRRVTVAWRTGPDGAVRTEPTGSGIELDPSLPSRLRPGECTRLPCGAGVVKLAGDVPDLWVMVADVNGANDAAALPAIDVVQALAAHVLERDRLRQAVVRLERAEGLQRALYEITDMASSGLDMPAMLSGLHRIVGRLMYAENFFIALYDADLDAIRFIYFADVADDEWQDPDAVDPMSEIEGSLTWHLIRHARPLMGPTSRLYEQVSGPLAIIGPGAADWLGVPIVIDGHVRGALVVQSYDRGDLYTPVERDLLTYVGTHIVTAIDRKRAFDRLEQQTHELERQIDVRRQVEQRLQHEVMHDPLTGLPSAMPILTPLNSSLSCTRTGSCIASMRRRARRAGASLPVMPCITIANSSPPRRATMSGVRRQSEKRRATTFSSSSPTTWPALSLITLKRSRSRNSTAKHCDGSRACAAIARARCSRR